MIITFVLMDAYQLIANQKNIITDTEQYIGLIKKVQDDYLLEKQYFEKLEKHRNPAEVRQELLKELDDYLHQIQNRAEMQDYDPVKNSGGYVNVQIVAIWEADKNLNSYFDAAKIYCQLREKMFGTIIVHFAEYIALQELYHNFDNLTNLNTAIRINKPKSMYNLLISSDENAWDGQPFILDNNRILSWTSDDIRESRMELSEDVFNELLTYPCIFAYESSRDKAPKYGIITFIRKRYKDVAIEYKVFQTMPSLSLDDFNMLKVRLDCSDKMEFSRTHWAVKNVDLISALGHHGIKVINEEQLSNRHPIVFISYSWDDKTHKEWVLALADKLIKNGVDVRLDQYELGLGKNLFHFMENSIKIADRVIVIFTPNYKAKAEDMIGGVGLEYSILKAASYSSIANNEKIIPILRQGQSKEVLPAFMQQYVHLPMVTDEEFEDKFQELLKDIYMVKDIIKPKLGKKPTF